MADELSGKERQAWFRFGIAMSTGALLIDQVSKWWVLEIIRLQDRAQIPIADFFNLTFVRNHGVSFGMLKADSGLAVWGLTLLSAAIATFFVWWMRLATRKLTMIALALVVGGALGNMIDRIRFGGVVDFLDFSALYFPWIFNVADACITVGATLLVLDYFTHGDENAKTPKAAKGES